MFRVIKQFFSRLDRQGSMGVCETCGRRFEYALVHNGFGDTGYAYCNQCGMTALLSGWHREIPAGAPLRIQGPIEPETEPWLQSCPCTGTFRRDASPRCPHCYAALSAELATSYIEKNAKGTKQGWRWQRNWLGMYAIIIEGRVVNNNWRK